MPRPLRFSASPWAVALALGSAATSLAIFSAGAPTRPWAAPAPPRHAAMSLRRTVYHPQPITLQPAQLLSLAGRAAPEPTFRVLLTSVVQNGRLKVSSASGLLVEDVSTHRLVAQAPPNAVYSVSLSPDGRALSGPGGKDLPSPRVRIEPLSAGTPMDTGARSYLGALEVSLGDAGMDVVNEVGTEDYITGVVAGEAARSFPLEALKAQAVAARTYAMAQRGHRSGVDVVDTTADQVYTGAGKAWPECRQAVQETAGQIATYDGKAIIAYFSADCGGHTRSNAAAGLGGRALPYLKAVTDAPAGGPDYCAVSPKHTWTARLPADALLAKLNTKLGAPMETLEAIRPTAVSYDGRVGEVAVEGLGPLPKPVAPTPAPVIAKPAPAAEPPPVMDGPASIGPADPTTTPPAPAKASVETPRPAASPATPAAPADARPQPDAPAPPAEAAPATPAPEPDPIPQSPPPAQRPIIRALLRALDFRKLVGTSLLRSQILTVVKDGADFVFSGRGYGHGVGLCQWGACGMARQGVAYDRILKHYYTGIALAPAPPRNGVLEGTAKDAEGRPLHNATVTLAGADRETKTDATGHFRFDALPAATYDLVLTPAAGEGAMSFAWTVAPDAATDAALQTLDEIQRR